MECGAHKSLPRSMAVDQRTLIPGSRSLWSGPKDVQQSVMRTHLHALCFASQATLDARHTIEVKHTHACVTYLPDMMMGSVCAWMGSGFSKPSLRSRSSSCIEVAVTEWAWRQQKTLIVVSVAWHVKRCSWASGQIQRNLCSMRCSSCLLFRSSPCDQKHGHRPKPWAES